ncbi:MULTISPECIES: homoprotocatechuate degradation operon regulator HpaR [Neptunomonas]|uniref:Homoprotocatechuate degradation operon regulator HpaR n=1 Tax=Neptunomonas marina TaxID=1815562 RepID=A0A437Q7Y0_9GAMM|nr:MULTISPECIES: homoprotocatechuate degradation operon regulator HpaR [Neptunomonas]RVU30576.1 homoprotocatechuate degradation operon regulator HpaR [Neptunomonas marina]
MHKIDESIPLQLLRAREATLSFFRPLLSENAVTEQQWRVFHALYTNGEMESKQLAKACCILSPSLTGIIQRMEQQELIQRRKSDEDQRRSLLTLTDKARLMYEEISPKLAEQNEELTKRISADKLKQLNRLLNELSGLTP